MSALPPSITDDTVFAALRSFLLFILPDGIEVVQAQDNRVPEPKADDFVVMTPTMRTRLSTNVDTYQDCAFTGSVALAVLTVTSVQFGTIKIGRTLFGLNVAANTKVLAQLSGISGGIGTYTISQSQTVAAQVMATGQEDLEQSTKIMVQLDIHGPNGSDNVQTISTLIRDFYGAEYFKSLGTGVSPLYSDDPHQAPFENEQQQYEDRWVMDVALQVKPVVTVPQQFAGEVDIQIINVEATFPP